MMAGKCLEICKQIYVEWAQVQINLQVFALPDPITNQCADNGKLIFSWYC
jgi:hypothetical protein